MSTSVAPVLPPWPASASNSQSHPVTNSTKSEFQDASVAYCLHIAKPQRNHSEYTSRRPDVVVRYPCVPNTRLHRAHRNVYRCLLWRIITRKWSQRHVDIILQQVLGQFSTVKVSHSLPPLTRIPLPSASPATSADRHNWLLPESPSAPVSKHTPAMPTERVQKSLEARRS